MNKIKLVCEQCGYERVVFDKELNPYGKEQCALCQNNMKITKEEIVNLVEQDLLRQIENNLINMGNNKVWQIIENMPIAKQRVRYRKLFFKVGGLVPIIIPEIPKSKKWKKLT